MHEEAKQLLATGFNYVLEKTTSCSSEDPKDSAPRRKVTVCEQESSFVDIKHNLFVIFRAIHIFAKLGLYCAPD
jgi:hypothetical protein